MLIVSDLTVPCVAYNLCVLIEIDFPAPLATKMYYSQRNNRLRAALRDLYFQESSNELCIDVATPNVSNEIIPFQDSCQRDPSLEQKDNELNMEVFNFHFYDFRLITSITTHLIAFCLKNPSHLR